jgi:tetratricopeptide (TPR) repeat protein
LNKGLYYFQKSLSVLEPWRIQLTLQKSERTETLDEEQSNEIYKYLSITERNLGSEYYNLRNFKKAGECYDRSISYGKEMMVGEERTDFIYEALTKKARGCLPNFDNIGAKAAYEETYELLAATDSYHPKALKNLGLLIPVLIELREFEDAERYARQLYHVLTHPIDTESQEVAETANSLASIIYSLVVDDKLVGDIKEAEMLSRKSIRIMERIQGPDFYMKGPYLHTLSRVLNHTGNEMEVKDLLEQSLVISKRTDLGGDRNLHRESQNVALVSFDLATLHYRLSLKHPPGALRTKQERIAESYRREAVRISTVLHGPTHPKTRFFETYDKKYIDMIASS